jgi:hypothetical protein
MGPKQFPFDGRASRCAPVLLAADRNEQLCRLLPSVAPAASLQQISASGCTIVFRPEVSFWRAIDGHSAM